MIPRYGMVARRFGFYYEPFRYGGLGVQVWLRHFKKVPKATTSGSLQKNRKNAV